MLRMKLWGKENLIVTVTKLNSGRDVVIQNGLLTKSVVTLGLVQRE